ncbi:MAG: Hpt domain-containing protein, partial [Hyphomicrobiaceae bacterium]|nr:Hpt domain-containing protein [Hyphomicrobiaceae bacterium]
MSSLDQFKTTYFQECEELLAAFEANLRDLKASPSSRDTLDAAFRAVHSIKGGAAMFRFDRIVGLAHAVETVLELARDGRVPITRRTTDKLLRAADLLYDLADAARSGGEA